VLEAVLKREQSRLKTDNFGPLLNDPVYHKSLLACTIEAIRYEYKFEVVKFEHVLYFLDLRPFYFLLIIEPFILELHHVQKIRTALH